MGLKKILKKVGKGAKKVAPLIMAGLAAKALMGRKRTGGGFLKSGAAGGASLREPAKPLHLGEGVARPYQDDIMHGGLVSSGWPDERKWYQKIFKKGGRVTGIAKRGFGRALMKGKK